VNVNVESLLELRWLLKHQRTAMGDDTTYVIGKATVRERHGATTFDDDDFGALMNSAESGGCGHSTGHASDNHNGLREC
jgi:hypothetical protein